MWYLVILIQYVFKIFDQTWFTCCRWSTLNCSADTHASALYTSCQTYLSKFPRWALIFHFHSKCPAENGEETLQTCESLWAKRKSSPLPSEDLLHRILLWYSKIPKKATHLVLHLVKEIPALHPLARPAAWDWERNSGWVAFLCQLPSGDTPAGDWLQLGSRRAVRAPRTFRFQGIWKNSRELVSLVSLKAIPKCISPHRQHWICSSFTSAEKTHQTS